MTTPRLAQACLLLVMLPALVSADESWPQFRGPTGQGHSTAVGLPIEFDELKGIAWKTPIAGRGWSSPVILDRQIWLTTALDEGRSLHAICVDRESGRVVHDVEVFRPDEPLTINAKNSHASPTPVIERGRVYVHFGAAGTACLSTETAEVLWSTTDLKIDHKEGPGSSPILHGDLFIVHCDGTDEQYIVALDKRTGEVVWKTERSGELRENNDFHKAYCTPLVIPTPDGEQRISTAADWTYAYEPATGRELWRIHYLGFSNVPRPVFGHGLLFIATGYNRPQLWAVRPDGQGDLTDSHVVWQVTQSVPANPSPLLVDGELYLVADNGVATCLDALTGEVRWRERLGGNYSASPLWAEGRIYFCSEDGEVIVIEANPSYNLLARNELDGRIMASPAAVGRALYLRTETHLYRIENTSNIRGTSAD